MIKHFCCSIFILLFTVSHSIAQNAYRLIDYDAEGAMYTITNGDADNFDPQKVMLTKYSELGVKIKEQKLNLFNHEYPVDLKVDSQTNSIYVLMKTWYYPSYNLPGNAEYDVVLAKFDLLLNFKWYYYFNYGDDASYDIPLGINIDSLSNIYFAVNTFKNDSMLQTTSNNIIKVDEKGTLIFDSQDWHNRISPNVILTCFTTIKSGETFAGGYVQKQTKKGLKHQSFLIAFDAKGKLRWQREIENTILKNDANNFISSIEVDNTKQVYFIIKATNTTTADSYTGKCTDSKLNWVKLVKK